MKYFTKAPGIGGRIRQRIEDFEVEEVAKDIEDENGEYVLFWIEKFNWDTNKIIKEISKRLHISQKRIYVAGTKDKRAVTRQRICIWNVNEEDVKNLKIKDVNIYNIKRVRKKLRLGELEGNRFNVTIRNVSLKTEEIKKKVEKIFSELRSGIPNLFGPQRFGEVRKLTHLVGLELLKGNFEKATNIYLCKIFENEPEDAKKAREFLLGNWGKRDYYLKALNKFPRRLRYERSILDYLYKHPNDFAGAIRRLPKRLRKMFLNAVQSKIFNDLVIEMNIKKQTTIPLIGYNTNIDKENKISRKIIDIMKRYEIKKEFFEMKNMPEIAVSGGLREAILFPKELKIIDISKDEINRGKSKVKISFFLPKGSYATIVLREVMKNE